MPEIRLVDGCLMEGQGLRLSVPKRAENPQKPIQTPAGKVTPYYRNHFVWQQIENPEQAAEDFLSERNVFRPTL